MKHTIEVEWEQVDALLVNELKNAHQGAMIDLDFELTKAIELVLRHWMVWDDYWKWHKDVNSIKASKVNINREWETDEIPF